MKGIKANNILDIFYAMAFFFIIVSGAVIPAFASISQSATVPVIHVNATPLERTNAVIDGFDLHAAGILPANIWGVSKNMHEGIGGWALSVSGETMVEFPSDLMAKSMFFVRNGHRISLKFATDRSYKAVYKDGRLYYVNENRHEILCYYQNQGDQKVREFILVSEKPQSGDELKYTWTFEGVILDYGENGTILVYERKMDVQSSKTRFETLDVTTRHRIEDTLKKDLGQKLAFSEKGKLLFLIPAPFYVDGRKTVLRDNITYSIDDPSTLSLTVASIRDAAFPLLIDPTIDASVADVKLVGESSSDRFGISVASAGDFNGDGKDDVIVGAYADDDGGDGSGCAFIFFGGVSPGTINASVADIKLVGEDDHDYFGWSVSSAGDFNGDGKDDVIVGAEMDDDGGDGSGCAFIFFGRTVTGTIDAANADVKLVGGDAGDGFGRSVSGVGDFNGDGKDDVIVGAWFDDDGDYDSGCAFIFFGRGSPPDTIDVASADIKLVGTDREDRFGYSVSGAGDFNGDGKDDVIVGAYQDDDGGYRSGCAFIFFGGTAPGTINASAADIKLVGEDSNDWFGYSVSKAGDFNGDGKDDVIVGARYDDDGGDGSGCAFIFFGRASFGTIDASNAEIKLIGEDSEDGFGFSVSGAGDFNGDGKDDVIVGARYDDDGGDSSGCAFIFFGRTSPETIDASHANVKLMGKNDGDEFGFSVSRGGRFSEEGNAVALVGTGWGTSNTAFVFFGQATRNIVPIYKLLLLD